MRAEESSRQVGELWWTLTFISGVLVGNLLGTSVRVGPAAPQDSVSAVCELDLPHSPTAAYSSALQQAREGEKALDMDLAGEDTCQCGLKWK